VSEMKIRARAGISVHRIELTDGQLPDMACGVNGVAQPSRFRPTHIDVEFDAAAWWRRGSRARKSDRMAP
jgi:hypothetical protein